ncbi:MAG TPA: lysophospholipid acyltransferase family protein [Terriglobales bacterium]|nr:lysophospholipid acyltransferase family protein [Terriglobales bacterium]
MRLQASVRTILLGLFFAVVLVLVIPVLAACALAGRRDPIIRIGQWAVRVGCRILGIRVEVSGLEGIDPGAPFIFMANHVSLLDGPLVATFVGRPVRIILKKSIFWIPVLGTGMRFVGFVPVDRKGAKGGQKSIRRAARLIREKGYSFLVFPEGTRSRDGKAGPFRRGGFFLALESGVPIVPVTIAGSFELMPRGQWYACSGIIRIAFHEPVSVDGCTVETMGALMEKVRGAIIGAGARAAPSAIS